MSTALLFCLLPVQLCRAQDESPEMGDIGTEIDDEITSYEGTLEGEA